MKNKLSIKLRLITFFRKLRSRLSYCWSIDNAIFDFWIEKRIYNFDTSKYSYIMIRLSILKFKITFHFNQKIDFGFYND